jgi:hypothetical protein
MTDSIADTRCGICANGSICSELETDASRRSRTPTDPVPQRSKVFIIECQRSNVFIKIDGMLQSFFRLLHMARDTCVAGEVKGNQSTLGMQRTRFEKSRCLFRKSALALTIHL